MKDHFKKQKSKKRGFTLIGMMVSVAIFSIVMLVAMGALLTITEASRKAQALKSVLNNLNFALEGMSRSIRTGTNYRCQGGGLIVPNTSGFGTPQDCSNGGKLLAFDSSGGDQVSYHLNSQGNRLNRCVRANSGSVCQWIPITSPDIQINDLTFYVIYRYRPA